MRKTVLTVFAAVLVVGSLAAWSHDDAVERKASGEMSIDVALRVGPVTLPTGNYRVVCNRERVTFTRTLDGKRFEVPCQGTAAEKKYSETTFSTNVDKNGVRFLQKLFLQGSNVEHSFD